MDKFKLSSYISITDVKEEDDEILPQKYKDGYFILYNEERNKEFLINASIKYFIDKFSPTAVTQQEVLELVKKELNTDNVELEKTCSEFFNFLVKKKILVPEYHEEPPVVEETLFKTGDDLDGYIIEDVIADKKDLDIYLVTKENTNNKAVIKFLNHKKITDPLVFEQELLHLKREYSLLQSVGHLPSINHTLDFKIKENEYAYIALEYITGKNLSRFFKATPVLTEEDCMCLVKLILEAFSLLHQCNLIHGDIHPSNIMVGEDNSIKIIDLGLSRTTEIDKNEILKHGGVTFYMPPERINISSVKKFSKEPDLFSDVYQLGLIMYLVLYNTTPFDGFIWEDLAHNIKEQEIIHPELSSHGFSVLPELKNIINKCTAKQPSERYKDATAILEDLKKHVLQKEETVVN